MTQDYAEQVEIDGRHYFGNFAALYAACGEDVCRTLMRAFGGREVCVPTITDHRLGKTRLAKVIGEDATRLIQREFGGGRILIPIGALSSAEARNREQLKQVCDLTAEGASLSVIARRLGVTTRTVSNCRRRLRARGDFPEIRATAASKSATA